MIMKSECYIQFFHGFYGSIWEPWEALEYETNENDEYFDDSRDTFNNAAYEKAIGEEVTSLYNDWLEEVGLSGVKASFVKIDSPTFYNFRNDEIVVNVEVSEEGKEKIWSLFWKNAERIKDMIKENHTSYDGFFSCMSNDMSEWDKNTLFGDRWRQPAYLTYAIEYIMICEFGLDTLNDLNEKAFNVIWEKIWLGEFIEYGAVKTA